MAKNRGAVRLDESPSHLLHRALTRALELYTGEAGPGAVTQRQYAVLSAVGAKEGVTQAELVKVTGIDRSTIAELVARMDAKGLIGREPNPEDRRANIVTLTDKGWRALAEAHPAAAAADQAVLKLLPKGKRDDFLESLKVLAGVSDKKASKKDRG